MSEMLDRVTKAIETEFFKVEEFGTGRGIVTPERIAKAAMIAMRHPTSDMTTAATEIYPTHGGSMCDVCAAEYWQAMIDAALK